MDTRAVGFEPKRIKGSRADSPAVAAANDLRAGFRPVVVDGVSDGELITVTLSMFSSLDIDPAYQRGETTMVGQIIRAVQAGGKVLDPVTLCQRKGSDKLWIVDGHQRVCAFQQLRIPFKAMLHKSVSPDAEHHFFIALNAKRGLNANVIVKAWTGPSGVMMRKANESLEHPLYGRLNFSQGANESRISATSLARGVMCVVGHGKNSGRVDMIMSRIDLAMAKTMNRARAEHYLRLIGLACPQGNLPALVLRAIGDVASERWEKQVYMPPRKVIDRMRVKTWAASVVLQEKYYSVLVDTVGKMWRA